MKRGKSMKFTSKRIIAIVLAAVLVFSISVAVGTFSAAENQSAVSALTQTASAPEAKAAADAVADQGEALPVAVVGNVKNIVKTSFETDSITLTWDKVPNASGYYVYCLNADGGKYTRVADVTNTTVTVKKMKHTTQYWFKVAAYLTVDGKKIEGQATVKKTATQPAKVGGLYMSRASTVNEMKWKRNDRATGYKVYRACYKTDGAFKLYKTINNNKTTVFTDKGTEQGRAYYYKIVAFRKLYGGEYNSAGNIIRFVAGMCSPGYTAVSRLSKVNLIWNSNRYAEGYDVLYSTNKSSGFKVLGSTKNSYYTTKNLTNNKTYYFRIRPYKHVGAYNTLVYGTFETKACKVTSGAYSKSVGGSYVEISISAQHMWVYKNGRLVLDTDVVTGNTGVGNGTPEIIGYIYGMQRNRVLRGANYASFVRYWAPFYKGYGIHDANWRGSFGGEIYKRDGSHGCVNIPSSVMPNVYEHLELGMPVITYY